MLRVLRCLYSGEFGLVFLFCRCLRSCFCLCCVRVCVCVVFCVCVGVCVGVCVLGFV